MIDWSEVLLNSLWLLGLALLLSSFGFIDYLGWRKRLPFRTIWRLACASSFTRTGALLFCTGMVVTAGSLLEQIGWSVLSLALLYNWMRHDRTRHSDKADQIDLFSSPSCSPLTRPLQRPLLTRIAELVVRTELLWLTLLAPFFLFPTPARVLALLVLPLLWLSRRVARGRFIPRTPLDWPIAILALMVLVSLYATPDLIFSLGKVTGLLLGVGIYYALVEWSSDGKRLPLVLTAYLLGGAGLATVGILGANWVDKWPSLAYYASQLPVLVRGLPGAEAGIPVNELAGSLLWLLPLQFSVWAWALVPHSGSFASRWLLRVGLTILTLLFTGTLLLTQSRSALIGAVVGVCLLLWASVPRARVAFLILAALATTGILYLGAQTGFAHLGELALRLETATSTTSIEGRFEIWSRAIYGIEDFPLTGMGMNSFRAVMPMLYPLLSGGVSGSGQDLGHAHNQFLQAALDLGLPGLVAYLSVWIIAAVLVKQTWHQAHDTFSRAVVIGAGSSLLAYFVYGITDTVALGAKPGMFFWALLALLVVFWRSSLGSKSSTLHAVEGTSQHSPEKESLLAQLLSEP